MGGQLISAFPCSYLSAARDRAIADDNLPENAIPSLALSELKQSWRMQVEAIECRVARLVNPDEPCGMVYAATVDSFQVCPCSTFKNIQMHMGSRPVALFTRQHKNVWNVCL